MVQHTQQAVLEGTIQNELDHVSYARVPCVAYSEASSRTLGRARINNQQELIVPVKCNKKRAYPMVV